MRLYFQTGSGFKQQLAFTQNYLQALTLNTPSLIPNSLQQALRNNSQGDTQTRSWYMTRGDQTSAGLVITLENGELFVDQPTTGRSLNASLNQPAGGEHWQKELKETSSRRKRTTNNTEWLATTHEGLHGTLQIGQRMYPITFQGGTLDEISTTEAPHKHDEWHEFKQFRQELQELLDEFREGLAIPLDYRYGNKTEHQPHSAPTDQPFRKKEGLNRYLGPLNQATPLAESKKETEQAQQMGDDFYTNLHIDSEEEDSSINDEESESECHREEEKNCDSNPESSI